MARELEPRGEEQQFLHTILSDDAIEVAWLADKASPVIQLRHIHRGKDGETIAEMDAFCMTPSIMKPITGTKLNLSSLSTRSSIVKALQANYLATEGSIIDWGYLLAEASNQGIKLCRKLEQGEPVTELLSSDEVKPLEYFIEPMAPLGKPTAIFGDPDSGKSQLLVGLAMLAILPWTDNPLRLGAPNESSKVLMLDYEADEDDIRRQLHALTIGNNIGWCPLYYRRCSLPIVDDMENIINHANNIDAKAVFIDSISLAAGGDLNKMEVATAYMRALRQLGRTTISVAHTSKDRESKSKTIIGSVLFEAGFRSVWECRGQSDENTLDIALFHRKSNLSIKSKPLGYRLTYDGNETTIQWHDPKSVPEFLERMHISQRILELLKLGPLSSSNMEKELQISATTCRVTLSRLKKKNLVIKNDDLWGPVTLF